MQVIEKETFEEMKVTFNDTSFIRSSNPVKIISKSPWMITLLDTYKWVIIGLGLFVISLVASFTAYRVCKRDGQSDSRVSIKIENAANLTNTSPTCPATTMAHTGTNPIE